MWKKLWNYLLLFHFFWHVKNKHLCFRCSEQVRRSSFAQGCRTETHSWFQTLEGSKVEPLTLWLYNAQSKQLLPCLLIASSGSAPKSMIRKSKHLTQLVPVVFVLLLLCFQNRFWTRVLHIKHVGDTQHKLSTHDCWRQRNNYSNMNVQRSKSNTSGTDCSAVTKRSRVERMMSRKD